MANPELTGIRGGAAVLRSNTHAVGLLRRETGPTNNRLDFDKHVLHSTSIPGSSKHVQAFQGPTTRYVRAVHILPSLMRGAS